MPGIIPTRQNRFKRLSDEAALDMLDALNDSTPSSHMGKSSRGKHLHPRPSSHHTTVKTSPRLSNKNQDQKIRKYNRPKVKDTLLGLPSDPYDFDIFCEEDNKVQKKLSTPSPRKKNLPRRSYAATAGITTSEIVQRGGGKLGRKVTNNFVSSTPAGPVFMNGNHTTKAIEADFIGNLHDSSRSARLPLVERSSTYYVTSPSPLMLTIKRDLRQEFSNGSILAFSPTSGRSLRPRRNGGMSYVDNYDSVTSASSENPDVGGEVVSKAYEDSNTESDCFTTSSKNFQRSALSYRHLSGSGSKIMPPNSSTSHQLTAPQSEERASNVAVLIKLEKCDSPAFLVKNSFKRIHKVPEDCGSTTQRSTPNRKCKYQLYTNTDLKIVLKEGTVTKIGRKGKEGKLTQPDPEKIKSLRPSSASNQVKYFPPTPTIKKRLNGTTADRYEWAIKSLHASTTPKNLPCRERELDIIASFLANCLSNRTGGCMYISGVPGTGKTAAVYQVLKRLGIERKARQDPSKEPFVKRPSKSRSIDRSSSRADETLFIEINGMKLRKPQDVYVKMYQKIFCGANPKISPDAACTKLESYFRQSSSSATDFGDVTNRHTRSVIVFIDELDLICTRKQHIVYNLFDWPYHQASDGAGNCNDTNHPYENSPRGSTKKAKRANGSRQVPCLVIITVANTMDLPERFMTGRVQSRLGLDRLTFHPYNHSQLLEIIGSRLKTSRIFKNDSVQYIARKVAALTGDARRALEICRRAVEVCRTKGIQTVGMEEVEAALDDIYSKPMCRILNTLSPYEKMFVKVLAADIQDKGGSEEAILLQVYEKFSTQCQMDGMDSMNFTQLLMLCNHLASYKIILMEKHAPNHRARRIRLNLLPSDVFCTLQPAQS